jgi:hypothetical protein
VWLDGEGVFEFFHPRLQILDLAPLFFQEEVFNLAQARLDGIESHVMVGKPFADHVGYRINGFLNVLALWIARLNRTFQAL